MKKILIFDFDGTIADSFSTLVEIVNRLAPEFGYKPIGIEEISGLRHLRAQDLMKIFKISFLKLPAFITKIKSAMSEQIVHVRPFAEIPETLHNLKNTGFTLGILSSNSEPIIREFLKNNSLELFDFVYCEKDLFGKARVLKHLIESHHFAKDEVVYVGDETRDAEAAHAAGVSVISVSWGFNTASALESVHPEALINHPTDLVQAVKIVA